MGGCGEGTLRLGIVKKAFWKRERVRKGRVKGKRSKRNEYKGICVYSCLQDSTCTPWVFTSCERTDLLPLSIGDPSTNLVFFE